MFLTSQASKSVQNFSSAPSRFAHFSQIELCAIGSHIKVTQPLYTMPRNKEREAKSYEYKICFRNRFYHYGSDDYRRHRYVNYPGLSQKQTGKYTNFY